jgi:amidase
VERPRLFSELEAGTESGVTLVSAPAGSGKTTLLSSWLESRRTNDCVAWIGVERGESDPIRFFASLVDALRRAGATIIDPVDTGDPFEWFDAEFTVLLFDFKVDIRNYLSTLRHTSMRTLADLIRFNRNHCEREMKYFGQEVFEAAQATSGDLSDPEYVRARQLCIRLGRGGINRVMRQHNLDAVLSPSYGSGSSAPAIAGYPVMCVPVGFTRTGKPVGVYLYAGFLQEPKLLKVAFGIEQLLQVHRPPRFVGHFNTPPDAGICQALVAEGAPERTPAAARAAVPSGRDLVHRIHSL